MRARIEAPVGVLYCIDELARMGGAEQNLVRLIRHLPRERFRPYLLTFRLDWEIEAFRTIDCPLEVYPVFNLYSPATFRYAPRLLAWMRRERIRIVHTFFETSDFWAGPLAKLGAGAALISSRRDLGIQRTWRLKIMYRLFRGMFDQVQAVSDAVRDYLLEADGLDPARVVTVPNGIALGDVPPRSANPEGRPAITTVANIRPVKGIDLLVRAAGLVVREFPRALFTVAGRVMDADYFAGLQRLVKEQNLEDNVRFVGEIARPMDLLAQSDVFLLPSRSEGMSNALLEAMACGLPAVATAVGGNGQLVRPGETGFLAPAEDVGGLAGAILALLKDPQLARRMGAAARRVVEREYSVEAVMEKMLEHYEAVLAG